MYEPVYSTYCREIGSGNRSLAVAIVPCFGTTFTKFEDDKVYWSVNGSGILKDEASGKRDIFIAPETQWVAEAKNHDFFVVTVTEYTKTVQTPFGDEMNKIINQKVKAAQKEYKRRKETEKRLYFYDVKKDRLELYTGTSYYNDKCRYRLNRPFTPYQALDKRYSKPKEDCFVLGRVRRTIGTKNGKLMDFIEPVAEFKLDYEDDWFGDEKRRLGNKIFEMLRFSILKDEPSKLEIKRIQNKRHCNVPAFQRELDAALEKGNVERINVLYAVVKQQQDCSNEKFRIVGTSFEENKELCVNATDSIWIRYENEELGAKSAEWVAENICKCANAKVSQQLLDQKYIFSYSR